MYVGKKDLMKNSNEVLLKVLCGVYKREVSLILDQMQSL